jgi:hypothetical protein
VRPTDDQFGWWLAGFVDGEGCLFIDNRGSVSLRIALRADDLPVLQEIQSRLGVGSVHRSAKASGGRYVCYSIHGGPNCLRALEALDGKMQSKKARDFEVWAAAVRASAALPKQSKLRRPAMLEYRRQLQEARAYA